MPIYTGNFRNTKNHKKKTIDINKLFKFIKNNWMNLNNHQKKALRNLLHFLELKYENNENMIKEINLLLKKLKLTHDKPDLYRPHLNDILLTIKQLPLKARIYYYIMVTSGCRVSEAVDLVNNVEKYRKVFLDKFVKVYVEKFNRSKKCFILFLPRALFEFICENKEKIKLKSKDSLRNYLRRRKGNLVRPKYCRKWFSSFLLSKGVSEAIIDFIQGRTPKSVLARNYLALDELATKEYKRILNELLSITNFYKNVKEKCETILSKNRS